MNAKSQKTSTSPRQESSDEFKEIRPVEGGCGAAQGFRFAGVHSGIKKSRPDLALIVSDQEATVAGMFTSNQVVAPPIRYCRRLLEAGGAARAVVVNSGNANACTGAQGMQDAEEMAALVAQELDCSSEQVYVSSTGVIGRTLPMSALRSGIPKATGKLGPDLASADRAATAILTTDTQKKTSGREVTLSTGVVRVGGMAKGSGMIAPDLIGLHATTLAYLTTDAVVDQRLLQSLLQSAMEETFNCITVDGDTSTNDTVLLLASGATGVELATVADRALFAEALRRVALDLALMVVRDGEGAQRLIEVSVTGASSDADARQVARTVANSPLVKTAFCAGEPNWGRFLMAVGRSGVDLIEENIAISVNDLAVVQAGLGTDHNPDELRREMIKDEVLLAIDLGRDGVDEVGSARYWTCDLSEEYVRINGHYLT